MNDVRQALDRLVPEPSRKPAWDGVLRDARPRRRLLTLQIGVAAGAAALVALFVTAPWRGTERVGILDRALAAVGDGPVLHVVLRDDALPAGTLVDLRTGDRKRIFRTEEIWYDTNGGLVRELSRFGGVIEYDEVSTVGRSLPKGRVEVRSSPDVERLARDYRDALKAGTARVSGRGVIDGISVYWITVPRGRMVTSNPNVRAPVDQVAVSRGTFKPVAIRTTQEGWPCKPSCLLASQRVLRMQSVAADAADLETSPVAPGDRLSSGDYAIRGPREIPLGEAAEILGRTPFWLGREHAGLQLAHASSLFFRVGPAPELSGLGFAYGGSKDGEPYISIAETTHRDFAARIRNYGSSLRPGSRMGYVPPEGWVLVTRKRFGFLVRDGVYVRMETSGEELLLDAARALRPLNAS
jgi:hypothetical protein